MKREYVPDLLLERYVLQETNPRQTRQIEDLLGENSGLSRQIKTRLKNLRQENNVFLESYPPGEIVKKIEQKYQAAAGEPEQRRFPFFPWIGSALAMAAILLFGFFINLKTLDSGNLVADDPGSQSGIRLKGDARLKLYRMQGEEVEELSDRSLVKNYETIQLSYSAGNTAYGTIFSLDGRGVVTLHYPDSPRQLPALNHQGDVALDFAYELDDAPDFERFFFITSPDSFDVAAILEAARNLDSDLQAAKEAPLDLPGEWGQISVLLLKENLQ